MTMSKIKDVLQVILLVSMVCFLIGLFVFITIENDWRWYIRYPLLAGQIAGVLIVGIKIYEKSVEK